jgi:hypothetical protein
MDTRLLIKEFTSFSLTLISTSLYKLTDDKSMLYFHDSERSDLFFIYLNEFLNTEFTSPIDRRKVSLFGLMEDVCSQYKHNEDFERFLNVIQETKEYFFKKRYYKYYISPHDIDFEISFAELINIQSNYSKHSYYHMTRMKEKLKKHFERNNIPDFENEDYNEHLEYFKEAVLDDRLNFNQTHIVEQLGKLFLAYWDLLNSKYQNRIEAIIREHIAKNGRLARWDFEKPKDFDDIEEFFWTIKGRLRIDRRRIADLIPRTWNPLIEKETSKDSMIEKNR